MTLRPRCGRAGREQFFCVYKAVARQAWVREFAPSAATALCGFSLFIPFPFSSVFASPRPLPLRTCQVPGPPRDPKTHPDPMGPRTPECPRFHALLRSPVPRSSLPGLSSASDASNPRRTAEPSPRRPQRSSKRSQKELRKAPDDRRRVHKAPDEPRRHQMRSEEEHSGPLVMHRFPFIQWRTSDPQSISPTGIL